MSRCGTIRTIAGSVLGLALAGLAGCGDGAKDGTARADEAGVVRCWAPTGSSGMCIERFEPLDDTRRLAAVVQCREGGGSVVAACPSENLVGTCETTENVKLAWTLNRTTRTSFYLHPDVASPDAISKLSRQCKLWTPAP